MSGKPHPGEVAMMLEIKRRSGNTWNGAPGYAGCGKAWPREVIADLGLVHKQAWRWLEKWRDRGWYEYGVTIDLGWLTEKAFTDCPYTEPTP